MVYLAKEVTKALENLNNTRIFVINRINKVALMGEKYSIPKGRTPESIILN